MNIPDNLTASGDAAASLLKGGFLRRSIKTKLAVGVRSRRVKLFAMQLN